MVDTSTLVIKEVFVLSQIRSEVQAPLPALSRSVGASASQRLVLGPGRQGRRRGEFHQTSLLKGISLPAAYRWKSKSKSTEIHTLCRLHCPLTLLFWWLNVAKCQDCTILLLFWWLKFNLNVTKAEMDYYMLLFWWLNVAKLGIVN